jgi:hypothetical protein
MRDIVLQVRLNERERAKLGKLAAEEQISLAEKMRLLLRDAPNPPKDSK